MSKAGPAERINPQEKALVNGLPANIDAERFVLGSVLLNRLRLAELTGALTAESFALQKHRTIWTRMNEIADRGDDIDRVTVANELIRYGELESIDGLSYLVSLDDGLPVLPSLTGYVKIIVDKHRLRRLAMSGQNIMNRAILGEETPDEIQNAALDGFSQNVGFGSGNAETVQNYVQNYPGGVNVLLDPSRWAPGIPTGLSRLDELTGGFHQSEIFLFGARPGHGKTAIATNIAKNVARQGYPVLCISLELQKQMFLNRMFCEEAYLSYSRFIKGELTEAERARLRNAMQAVMEMPLWVDAGTGLTMSDIRVKVMGVMRQAEKPPLVVIDYAQLIRGNKKKRFSTENDKFTDIGEDMKKLCNDTGCPLLLLSQLNRDSEKDKGDTRPKLSQCRGAGIWEEIAFVGACIYREYKSKPRRADLRDVAELLLNKNRSGEEGIIPLRFEGWAMRFSDGFSDPYAEVVM